MDTSGRIVLPRAKSSGAAGLVKTAEQAAALRASRAAEQTLTDLLNETAAAAADAFDDDEDDDTTDDDTTDAFVPGNLAPFLRTLGKRLHTALNNNDGSAAAAAAASSYSVRYTEAAPCVTTMFQGGVHFLVLSPSASSSPSSNTTATTTIPASSSAPGIRVSSPPRQSPPTEAELASREGAVFVVLNMRAHWSLRCGGSRRYRALLAEALHGGEHFVGTQPRLWTLLESLEKVLRADVFERDLPPWRRAFAWKAALGRPPCAAEETEAAAAAERPAAALHEFITEATVEEGGEAEAASAGAPSSSSAEDCSEYGLGSSLGHLTSVDSCESLHDAAAAAQRSRRQQQQHISVASATA